MNANLKIPRIPPDNAAWFGLGFVAVVTFGFVGFFVLLFLATLQ